MSLQEKLDHWKLGAKVTLAVVFVFFMTPLGIIILPLIAGHFLLNWLGLEENLIENFGQEIFLISLLIFGPYFVAQALPIIASKSSWFNK